MKKLHVFILKSFFGPFIMTFFIVLFILLMQFLWRYIDDLVGKGLKFNVILELLLYTSFTLISLALPLSILMSSLMTFGSMGEYYELTAIKASGISLQKALMPIIILVIIISISAFFFSNNILPITNLRMKSLLMDIRNQRPELQIKEREFYNGIDNYSVRIDKKNPKTNVLYDIKIYDHSQHFGNIIVTVADSGHMMITNDKQNLLFTLWNGCRYVEIQERNTMHNTYPHRIEKFREQRFVIKLSGYSFERTDASVYKNHWQMLNVEQLEQMTDSLNRGLNETYKRCVVELMTGKIFRNNSQLYGFSGRMNTIDARDSINKNIPDLDSIVHSLTYFSQKRIITKSLSNARSLKGYLDYYETQIISRKEELRKYENEWHRKFTLSFACLVFLLIGAPLGSIIRKGGLGMPAVISVVMFIFYYIITLVGEKFARESVVSSFEGMWASSFILLVVGIFITYKATTDSSIFNLEIYLNFFQKILGIEKIKLIEKKWDVAGKFKIVEINKADFKLLFSSLINKGKDLIKHINESTNYKKLFFPLFLNKKEEYSSFENIYNNVFDTSITSKWARIKSVKQNLEDFPYINFNIYRITIPKYLKIGFLVLFPLGLVCHLWYYISIINLKRKVNKIISNCEVIIHMIDSHTSNQDSF